MPITRTRTTYITPTDDAYSAVLDAARNATVSCHVLAYGFTTEAIADALIDHRKAGRSVGVVADRTQSAGPAQKALLQRLVDNGVPVTITTSPTGAIQHTKALILDMELEQGPLADGSWCMYGSYNLTGNPDGHGSVAHSGAEAQGNICVLDNDPSICAYLWRSYQEMEAHGRSHPEWQLTPGIGSATHDGQRADPPTPGDLG